MAILSVQVSDETEQIYAARGGSSRAAMSKALEAFKGVDPADRLLVVDAESRRTLEKLLAMQLPNIQSLVDKVQQILSLDLEGIAISLTPAQKLRLEKQAHFNGREPMAFIEEKLVEAVKQVAESA